MSEYVEFLFDAGHGGKDSGAVNGRVYEKKIVLEIAKKTADYLKPYKCGIKFTRSHDKYLTLAERTNMSGGFDFLLSFHTNASVSEEPNGFQTYIYTAPTQKEIEVANIIQNELNHFFTPTKWSGVKRKNLHMTREAKCPSVLLELGFISNASDLKLLQEKQNVIANAIAWALVSAFNLKKHEETPKQTIQPTPIEVKPNQPKKKYTSIVEYLQSINQPYSFNHRKNLAKQIGIKNYTGTAGQNAQLLKYFQG